MDNREIIKVTEFEIAPLCNEYYWEDVEEDIYYEYFNEDGEFIKHHFSNDFEVVDKNVIYYDLEKSYEDIDIIIKRKSDGKYFKANWLKSFNYDDYPTQIEEVFPIEVTTTVYK
jgi:hypothetical protein